MLECIVEVQKHLNIPAELMVAIAYVESRFNPYAVNLQTNYNIDGYLRSIGVKYLKSRGRRTRYMYNIYPRTLSQAKKLKVVFRDAKTYDVGLMQINVSNFRWMHRLGVIRSVDDLFDPCRSVIAGGIVLRKCIDRFGMSPRAIDCYNKGAKRSRFLSSYVLRVADVLGAIVD